MRQPGILMSDLGPIHRTLFAATNMALGQMFVAVGRKMKNTKINCLMKLAETLPPSTWIKEKQLSGVNSLVKVGNPR